MFVEQLKWSVYQAQSAWKWGTVPRREQWILSRTACLGNDVLNMLALRKPVLNVQKGRIDYLLDCVEHPELKARPWQVVPHMARMDIMPLVVQQSMFPPAVSSPPGLLYMDSYAELTDQLFIHHKRQWRFCCNYSDIRHDGEFQSLFETAGLLPVEELEFHYRKFFNYIRKSVGQVPVVFLHFPSTLDKREKYKARQRSIAKIIAVMAEEFPPFYSLSVDDSIVDWPEVKHPETEDFPYHYNQRTYEAFIDAIHRINIYPF